LRGDAFSGHYITEENPIELAQAIKEMNDGKSG
jgi:hypothetical protein